MAFKTVNDLSTDNTIALGGFNKTARKDNPTTLTGYYLGSREVASPKSKTGFAFIHVFQTPTGNVGVWGKTDLDRKIKAGTLGALTRVTFDGMLKIPGKNDMYKYKVEIDDTNTIEVSAPEAAGGDTGLTSTDGYAGDYSADEPSFDSAEDDVDQYTPPPAARRPATPAQAPTAAEQAQVQAMVRKRK